MAYCACNKSPIEEIAFWERFPLSGHIGNHTQFAIFKCKKCDKLKGFPHTNLLIALEKGTDEGKAELEKILNG